MTTCQGRRAKCAFTVRNKRVNLKDQGGDKYQNTYHYIYSLKEFEETRRKGRQEEEFEHLIYRVSQGGEYMRHSRGKSECDFRICPFYNSRTAPYLYPTIREPLRRFTPLLVVFPLQLLESNYPDYFIQKRNDTKF